MLELTRAKSQLLTSLPNFMFRNIMSEALTWLWWEHLPWWKYLWKVALVVKNLPVNVGDIRDAALILGLGRSPGDGMATHSSILAWRIPRKEEPGGLQSIGSQSQTQLKRLSTHISRLYFHSKELGVDHLPSHHWGHFLNKSLVLQSLVLENSALERNYVGSLLSDRGFRR